MSDQNFPRHPRLVPEPLRLTYLRTEVRVHDETWLDPAGLLARRTGSVLVITACNPMGELVTEEENQRRMTDLRVDLDTDEIRWLQAEGRDPTGDWLEPSFAVLDTDRRTARDLGRVYDQFAIFELTDDEQIVHGCQSRWSRRRAHGAGLPIGEGATLIEAVDETLGSRIARDLKRFRLAGWHHTGPTELGCAACGRASELFSVIHTRRDGTIVDDACLVCPSCATATMVDELDPDRAQMIERWRDHLLAQQDAEEHGGKESVHCYVIQLGEADDRWVYVGQTAKDPVERYEQHKKGHKANAAVRDHGVGLRGDLMAHLPTFTTRLAAETYERYLGAKLAVAGYRVEGAH